MVWRLVLFWWSCAITGCFRLGVLFAGTWLFLVLDLCLGLLAFGSVCCGAFVL